MVNQLLLPIDVEKDPDYALYRNAVKEAGFRSVQSTPFVTEDGKLIGIVSVHFAVPGGRRRVPEKPSASTLPYRANVRLWHKADTTRLSSNVRFWG